MQALGKLLRLSLAPSVIADVAAGLVFASGGRWPSGAGPLWLMASSACVYHGALAINDWHDREHDARTRPSRPIPRGEVQPETALAIGASLLVIGPLLALLHSHEAAFWSFGLASLALIYDLIGRGPWIGPVLLALCRSGNLGLGLLFANGAFGTSVALPVALLPMAIYAVYVLRISQLGRMEDGEEELQLGRPAGLVLSAALMLALLPFLPPFSSAGHALGARFASAALALPAAITLARPALTRRLGTRQQIETAMGLALRRLSIFGAALAALAWHPPAFDAAIVAAAILAGYAVSARLRVVFPPS